MRFLRFFRPEVERAIKLSAIVALGTVYFTTLAWGYDWRRQARSWRDVACEHELKLIAQPTSLITVSLKRGDACGTLDQLGLARHDRKQGAGRFALGDSRAVSDKGSRQDTGGFVDTEYPTDRSQADAVHAGERDS